jgi:hypothetical protein
LFVAPLTQYNPHGLHCAVLFVALSLAYGYDVGYRFEVAAITVDWMALIVAATLRFGAGHEPKPEQLWRRGREATGCRVEDRARRG